MSVTSTDTTGTTDSTGTTGTTGTTAGAAIAAGAWRESSTSGAADSRPQPDQVIDSARAEIDALDAHIIALVRKRVDVSARIQRTRVTAGGRRVHLAREMQILGRYRDELGRPGTSLAMTLLELSRGRG